jgi:glycosyltransferase involved in cell wall biosynthesis
MSQIRILEIGAWTYCKDEYPDRTTLLWTGERPCRKAGEAGVHDCTPLRFLRAMRDVRDGKYDIVVTYMQVWPAWNPRYWLRSLLRDPLRPFAALTRVFGVTWLRFVRPRVPFAAIDMNDSFVIGRQNFFLLDRTDATFKRELPADRWLVLCHSAHAAIPTRRIRRQPRWIARMAKLRPIALPAPPLPPPVADESFPEKTADLFFSGDVGMNSWVRSAGRAELDVLKARGIAVDFPTERLAHPEFLKRMSQAWLAWSPAGFGWECYRTAEAAQCLTVPVVNYPTIERHAPLRQGEHAVFYDAAPGELTRAVEEALRDKEKLRKMATAARAHVVAHHVGRAMIDYVVAETRRSAGVSAS